MSDEKVRIIEAVKTPIAFFVLVILLVEGILGLVATKCPDQRTMVVLGMLALIFLLVVIVATLSYYRPEALKGVRFIDDPELDKIRQNFQEVEKIAAMISGIWEVTTSYRLNENSGVIDTKAICEITKGKFGILMHGHALNPDGSQGANFIVKQVFIGDDGLTFIYEVPQGLGKTVLGVGQVRFILPVGSEKLIKQMKGNWGVLGSETSGSTEFNRNN